MDSDRNEWVHYELGDITLITAGGDRPSKYTNKKTIECYVPIYSNGIDNEGLYGYTDVAKIHEESITISARGTIGYVCLRLEPYVPIVRLISIIPNKKENIKLSTLRDTLLPKLMSGELSVEEVSLD